MLGVATAGEMISYAFCIMTLSSDLERAVNELYRVFREYRLAVDFPGRCSPLGDRRKLAARLAKQELHTTGVDDLAVYAFKAITTMGNSVDYKHFLPRMFELMATDSAWWDHHTLVFQKLHELKWTSWPRAEQDSIRGFFGYVAARCAG